jgi:hypothetical protein
MFTKEGGNQCMRGILKLNFLAELLKMQFFLTVPLNIVDLELKINC